VESFEICPDVLSVASRKLHCCRTLVPSLVAEAFRKENPLVSKMTRQCIPVIRRVLSLLQSNVATGPSGESLPATADPEKDEDSCSEMEEDFLDPPDVRPLWGNEIATMLRNWKMSDDSWRRWDLDSKSRPQVSAGRKRSLNNTCPS
jgi:hypothetical protein